MATVALLGLGRMGSGIAASLLRAGHDLTVWNRTPSRAAGLLEHGARWADTPAQAASGAEAVVAMVSDDAASRALWSGPVGVLSGHLLPGALAIECSTLSAAWVAELSGRAAAAGLRYLDSPVTGLPDAAAAGRLTLLVGGSEADVAAAGSIFEAISDEMIHFGPVGSGTVYKLIVNLMGAVQIAGVAEGLAMAERAGLDLGQVARAISTGQAASPQVVRQAALMALGDHGRVTFSGRLRHKDAAYGVRLAEELGLGAPLGQVALAGLDALVATGLGDLNESAVIEVARGLRPPITVRPTAGHPSYPVEG